MSILPRWLTTLALIASPLATQATTYWTYWSPHIGAEYKYWGVTTGRESPYEQIFPRIDNAFNLYVGTRVNGFFGVDVGYEACPSETKTKVYEGGEIIFAEAELPNNSSRIDLQLHTVYGAMNFYWEVVDALELIFMMGAAYVYPHTHIMHLSVDNGAWVEYQNRSEPFWSGRFGFAAQYNVMTCLGIKGSVTFDQILRLEYLGVDEFDNAFDVKPYRKAVSFGIGLVYSFIPPRPCRDPYRTRP